MLLDLSPPVFRFAPSPNGALHLGHAYSAIINFEMARAMGGRFLVRVEDIDQQRCTPALTRAMLDDLAWLGLVWEEPVRLQSAHFADYQAALETLENEGFLYRSSLTRGDIRRIAQAHEEEGGEWPRDPDGALLFPGRDYETDADHSDSFNLRLDMKAAVARVGDALSWREYDGQHEELIVANPAQWGDVILARRDTPTSYHLAVVVDDALQNVNHVVRGRDLFEATAVHILLQKLLGLPEPIYHHHDLILDADGEKLSKSRGDTSLRALRDAGLKPSDIRRMIGL